MPLQNRETPVLIAIGLNEDEILQKLLKCGADPNLVKCYIGVTISAYDCVII